MVAAAVILVLQSLGDHTMLTILLSPSTPVGHRSSWTPVSQVWVCLEDEMKGRW